MRKLPFSFTLLFLVAIAARSQSVTPSITNASGGSYQNPSSYFRYFDWSVGELVLISTVAPSDSSIVLYQGVLQPCTEKPGFSPVNGDFQLEDVKVMPNPTTGKFEVNFFVRENGMLNLELVDMQGKVLEKRGFRYNGNFRTEQYDISQLPAGIYLLVATLMPDQDNNLNMRQVMRHSSIKIIKLR